ncbi:MAG TPA: AAA family ATPase [Thermoanaerobaculia bacterium]|nr:AAA family ATPase [Thermoanaerobaculia bacterium]
MRVAISGTHGCGKSTLIDAFLHGHGDYVHEPEAYEALQDVYGEPFAADPSADDLYRQLEYHVGRLQQYRAGDRVIFERSPVDYLAYLLALEDLDRDAADARLAERSLDVARGAVAFLDVIVYLPATGGGGSVPDSEDPELRRAVDARLESILIDDDFDMFTASRPSVLEALGSTAQRLRTLETALRLE